MHFHSFLKTSFLAFAFIGLSACQEVTLLQELDQQNTNAVMVVLAKHGIKAKKETVVRQQKTSWTIFIPQKHEDRARELLVENHLPRQRELGLAGVCEDPGMIPTPKMEKCRELLAIKGEIINSLQSIKGVVHADVVINIPEKEDFPDENKPPERPTASVVVEFSEAAPSIQSFTEEKLQRFVANAVSGMDRRDVAVILSYPKAATAEVQEGEAAVTAAQTPSLQAAQPDRAVETQAIVAAEPTAVANEATTDLTSVGGLQMASRSAKKFKIIAILFLSLFALLGVAVIYLLFKVSGYRRKAAETGGDGNLALPEKAAMDQLVQETGQAEQV